MSQIVKSSGLVAQGLALSYGPRKIIDSLELALTKPEIVSIIGPNGSGKSTLLKSLCRLLEPTGGAVYLDGKNINTMTGAEVAKTVAVMAQSATTPGGTTVQELVTMGRMPHRSFLAGMSNADKEAVEAAIAFTELEPLRHRLVHTLSGGERQRAWLAMALAQEPRILLLDEPTTYLDVHHQLELMELVVRLQRERKMLIVMVLHDLNHAARFSHRLIALKHGQIMADGPTETVFTEPIIEKLYDVKAVVMQVEACGRSYPVCLPYSVHDA